MAASTSSQPAILFRPNVKKGSALYKTYRDVFMQHTDDYYKDKFLKPGHKPWSRERVNEVIQQLKQANLKQQAGIKRTSSEYHYGKKYAIKVVNGVNCLFTKSNPILEIVAIEDVFDLFYEIHMGNSHPGRDKMSVILRSQEKRIPKALLCMFQNLCEMCYTRRHSDKHETTHLTVTKAKPNNVGIIFMIDMTENCDGKYKYILAYKLETSGFLQLRPIKTESPIHVVPELLKLFLTFIPTKTIKVAADKDNLTEAINFLASLKMAFPMCEFKIIEKETLEAVTQRIKRSIIKWMEQNKSSKWSFGCYCVQAQINMTPNIDKHGNPYQNLYNINPQYLTNYNIPQTVLAKPENVDYVKLVFNQDIGDNEEMKSDDDENGSEEVPIKYENTDDDDVNPLLEDSLNLDSDSDPEYSNLNQTKKRKTLDEFFP